MKRISVNATPNTVSTSITIISPSLDGTSRYGKAADKNNPPISKADLSYQNRGRQCNIAIASLHGAGLTGKKPPSSVRVPVHVRLFPRERMCWRDRYGDPAQNNNKQHSIPRPTSTHDGAKHHIKTPHFSPQGLQAAPKHPTWRINT